MTADVLYKGRYVSGGLLRHRSALSGFVIQRIPSGPKIVPGEPAAATSYIIILASQPFTLFCEVNIAFCLLISEDYLIILWVKIRRTNILLLTIQLLHSCW